MLRLRHSLPNFTAGLLTCLCSLSLSMPGAAGDLPADATPATTATPAATTDDGTEPPATPSVEAALRQLKEQQVSTFQALDLIRRQTESALTQNASVLSNQLAQFNIALLGNAERQLQFMRDTQWRTLYATMLIFLAVLIGVAGLVLVAARAFKALAKRLPLPAPGPTPGLPEVPKRIENPVALLEQSATSAYAAALLDVETRIAALERRPVPTLSAGPVTTAPSRRSPAAASRTTAPAKPPPSSLAMALGDGQAIVFLPRERSIGAAGRIGDLWHRFGRLFASRKSSAPAKPLPRPRLV